MRPALGAFLPTYPVAGSGSLYTSNIPSNPGINQLLHTGPVPEV